MKKVVLMVMAVSVCMLFTACEFRAHGMNQGGNGQTTQNPVSQEQTIEEQTTTQGMDYGLLGSGGTFYDNDGYSTQITFFDDGTYTYTVNLAEGMGNVSGAYYITGNTISLTVLEKDFYGFVGDDVTEFGFFIEDSNTITLSGLGFGIVYEGTTYKRS